MDDLDEQMNQEAQALPPGQDSFQDYAESRSARLPHRGLSLVHSSSKWNDAGEALRCGDFLKLLSLDAIREFEQYAKPHRCASSSILLMEGKQPDTALLLLQGSVKLSVDSMECRHLTLGIARPGDVLGLAAVVSGLPYQMTALAQVPCLLASLPRSDFLAFLLHYPVAAQNAGLQLSKEYAQACDQAHSGEIGLDSGTKLARLLLKWCSCGSETAQGIRIECSLTDEEIGECIGMACETVSRVLGDLQSRELVTKCGSALIVSSVRALENYANLNDN